jgi:hypothetical protein
MLSPYQIEPDLAGHFHYKSKTSIAKPPNGPTQTAIWQTIRGKVAFNHLVDVVSHKFKEAKKPGLFVGGTDVKFNQISQNSIIFGIPRQYGEETTSFIGNCNGQSKLEYETPLEFLRDYFFAGVMTEDVPGDQSRMVTTVNRGATFNFIHPKTDGAETLYADMLMVPVPDTDHVFTWDSNDEVIGFKWVTKDSLDKFFMNDLRSARDENEVTTKQVTSLVYNSGYVADAIVTVMKAINAISNNKTKTEGQKHTQRYALLEKTKFLLDFVDLAKSRDLTSMGEAKAEMEKRTKPKDSDVDAFRKMCDKEEVTHGIMMAKLRPRARIINGGLPGSNIYAELLQ